MFEIQSSATKNSRCGRILVLGLGNILLCDEGVGVHVAQLLQKVSLPANVEVVDGGTAAMDVFLSERDIEKVIVIDAVKAGQKPGTIYKSILNAHRASSIEHRVPTISLHQIGFFDALAIAKRANTLPEKIVIIGIEPANVGPALHLTDIIERKVPEIIEIVLKEIKDDIHPK